MTVDFNQAALSQFENLNFSSQDAIVTKGPDQQLQSTQNLGHSPLRWIRSDATQQANNAMRTELLRSLGEAFGLRQGIEKDAQGRTTFSKGFMDKLQDLIGPDLKAEDFGVNGSTGLVSSGKPLTKRRIDAILARVTSFNDLSRKNFDADAYQAKLNTVLKDLGSPGTQRIIRDLLANAADKQAIQEGLKSLQGCINLMQASASGHEFIKEAQAGAYNDEYEYQLYDVKTGKYVDLKESHEINDMFMKATGLSIDHGKSGFRLAAPGEVSSRRQFPSDLQHYVEKNVTDYTAAVLNTYLSSKQAGRLSDFLTLLAEAGECIEDRLKKVNDFNNSLYLVSNDEFQKHNLGTAITTLINEARKENPHATWDEMRGPIIRSLADKRLPLANQAPGGFTPILEDFKIVAHKAKVGDIDRLGSLIACDFQNHNLVQAMQGKLGSLPGNATWEDARNLLTKELVGTEMPIATLEDGKIRPVMEMGEVEVRAVEARDIETLGQQLFAGIRRQA